MRLRLMAVSPTIILAGCVPRAGSDYRFDPNPAPPAAKGPQILTEQRLFVETPSWSPASVERYARRVVTSIYQVQSGDSLFSIANKTGAGATAIANADKLMPSYTLQLGQNLLLPLTAIIGTASRQLTPELQAAAFILNIDDIVTGGNPAGTALPVPATAANFAGRFA